MAASAQRPQPLSCHAQLVCSRPPRSRQPALPPAQLINLTNPSACARDLGGSLAGTKDILAQIERPRRTTTDLGIPRLDIDSADEIFSSYSALLTDPWVFGSARQGGTVAAEGEHG